MSWTDERIDRLKELWSKGMTASQIADELGNVSRNAVIGKAHRLGLQSRPSPVKPNEPTPAKPRSKAPAQAAEAKPQAPAAPAARAKPAGAEAGDDTGAGPSPAPEIPQPQIRSVGPG